VNSYGVRIWDIGDRTVRGKKWYRLRWTVEGAPKPFEKLYERKALATSERAGLISAANAGTPFSIETGKPITQTRQNNPATCYEVARDYIGKKWPRLSANSRRGTVEALVAVTMLNCPKKGRGRPADATIRRALSYYAFNPRRWEEEIPDDYANALKWVKGASSKMVKFNSLPTVRNTLDGLCILLDGSPAAAITTQRKRAAFYNFLGFAVENEYLDNNPIDRLQWTAPEVAVAIDRRVVANPTQVKSILDANREHSKRADRVTAFFGCLYYGGTRPSEAADLHEDNCELPGYCKDCEEERADVRALPPGKCQHDNIEYRWGSITLVETDPRTGSHWTDDGRSNQRRGLKHRPRKTTRIVPAPPELVALLHRHITLYGVAPDGRLFRGLHGGPLSPSVWDRWWKLARQKALTATQAQSPLARRPYDLRHAAASLWLNNGIPATEVARRLGNSVKVLLATYANCIDGDGDDFNGKISQALS
jgi:integrase